MHPFIIGELALGSLADRRLVLDTLGELPMVAMASCDEILHFIEDRRLFGTGIGYVDTSILAAVLITDGAKLWTGDRRLLAASERLSVDFDPFRP